MPTDHPGQPLAKAKSALFAASGNCSMCHTDIKGDEGHDISADEAWRSTMMANAARDPYWLATVRAEALAAPALKTVIEDKCATCHTPMARSEDLAAGKAVELLDGGYLSAEHPLGELGRDGVSCTLCHQLQDHGEGLVEAYSGGFAVDARVTDPPRQLFGPNPTPEAQAEMMAKISGFLPVQGQHMERSSFCATCHTLFTPYLDESGQVAGSFPEQTAFLEWQRSDWADQKACQDCHMPAAQRKGQPFHQHHFVGGNLYVLGMLRASPEVQGVTASSANFAATMERTAEQLQQRSAQLALEDLRREGATLSFDAAVTNLAGHKLPTGFPSRRAWIHLVVRDATGAERFSSGAPQPDGTIQGNDNDADPASYERHHREISRPDQVQIYESILGTVGGRVTTTLLQGAGYLKDNRLLPAGLERSELEDSFSIRGEAVADLDFDQGGERVRYEIDLGGAQGPFDVEARLLYQSVAARWERNLAAVDAPEVQAFTQASARVANEPTLLASASAQVE